MANKYISQSRAEHTRVYPTFAGVDFSSDPADVEPHRFAYIKNMWRDYGSEQGGAVETVPGFLQVFRGAGMAAYPIGKLGRVRGLHPFKGEDGRTLIAVDYYSGLRILDPDNEGWVGGSSHDIPKDEANLEPEFVELYYDDTKWDIPDLDAPNSKSVGWHGGIAVVDGKRYRVIRDGAKDINEEYEPYIPITYADGKPYEQRNMLTDRFIHKYNLLNLDDYETEFEAHPEYEDLYEFELDLEEKTVMLKGFKEGKFKETLIIPETVNIFGESFSVAYIKSEAFSRSKIKKVFIPKSVKKIFSAAFIECESLEEVVFDSGYDKEGSELALIEEYAFSYCPNLKNIQLPLKIKADKVRFEFGAFYGCSARVVALSPGTEIFGYEYEGSEPPFVGTLRLLKNGPISFAGWAGTEEWFNQYFAVYDYTVESVSTCFDEEGNYRANDVFDHNSTVQVLLGGDASATATQITLGRESGIAAYHDSANGVFRLYFRYQNYVEARYTDAPEIKEEHLYGFTLYEKTETIDAVRIDGIKANELGCKTYSEKNSEGYIGRVLIGCSLPNVLRGRVLTIEGTAESTKFTTIEGHNDAMNGNAFYKGTGKEAIDGCTLCEAFDGRIFLSGNPKLPNTVFYTHRDLTGANNPTYFGVLNFFNDGVGNEPITSLLATSSALCVLKGDTQNEGSIYYHTGADTGEDILPRIYPATQGAAGIGCLGASCNFLDDPVFISRQGLESIGKEQTNLERSIEHRSYNVDAKLLQEELREAMLAEWQGYLVIAFADRIYLADSRQRFTHKSGFINYEWYYIEGVSGYDMAYESDVASWLTGKSFLDDVYTTISQDFFIDGYPISECYVYDSYGYRHSIVPTEREEEVYPNRIFESSVYTDAVSPEKNLGQMHFVMGPGGSLDYVVHPCGMIAEKKARRTFKITSICSVEDKLFFGTEGGCVYRFNTDKREANGRIPEEYYSFGGVRYESAFALKADNCDIPGYTKKTSRGSFVLRTKPFRHSRIKARGRADRGELSVWREIAASTSSDLDFNATAFDAFSFGGGDAKICIVRENFRRWYEKQLYFYTDGFCEPFGVYSASFRYTLQGKLKV